MFVAHAIPRPDQTELIVDGRSSILFATLAGISLGLMTGGASPLPVGARRDRVASILLRALMLFVLGVLLQTLGSEIAVILDYYGIMFALLVPLLFAPRLLLIVIAAVMATVMPWIAAAVDDEAPLSVVEDIAHYYLLTGYYPVLLWLPFLLVGLAFARSDTTNRRTQQWMIGLGGTAAVAGYGAAAVLPGVSAEAHSGSVAELVGSGGFAIGLIGLALLFTARMRESSALARAVSPLAATGSMALTVYTAQIIVLSVAAWFRDFAPGSIEYPGWPLLISMTAITVAAAWTWRRYIGQGPLEWVMARLTGSRPMRSRPMPAEAPHSGRRT